MECDWCGYCWLSTTKEVKSLFYFQEISLFSVNSNVSETSLNKLPLTSSPSNQIPKHEILETFLVVGCGQCLDSA